MRCEEQAASSKPSVSLMLGMHQACTPYGVKQKTGQHDQGQARFGRSRVFNVVCCVLVVYGVRSEVSSKYTGRSGRGRDVAMNDRSCACVCVVGCYGWWYGEVRSTTGETERGEGTEDLRRKGLHIRMLCIERGPPRTATTGSQFISLPLPSSSETTCQHSHVRLDAMT